MSIAVSLALYITRVWETAGPVGRQPALRQLRPLDRLPIASGRTDPQGHKP